MHQKTRYNIRYAERKGVVVRQGSRDDLPILEHFLHILGSEAKFAPRKLEYFQKEWDTFDPLGEFKIFIASHEKTVLAIHAHAKFGQHAAYFHGASSGEMKQLMPNYMLMWEAIKWAKSENCRTFDLWGIPDEVGLASYQNNNLSTTERTDGLWGVYRFKRGFSTNVILYSSAHDYIYNPLLYRFVNNRFINSSLLERVAVWMDNMRGG
jgi:lipid II:glycine glycyltransferase (peptidoglycan interpeptide bridge formation enzyme)